MRKALCAAAFVLAKNASAAEWMLFDKSEHVSSYIDLQSLRMEEARHVAWIKHIYAAPQKLDKKKSAGKYSQMLALVRMDCARRYYTVDESIYTTADGKPLTTDRARAGPQTVVLDTPSEILHDAICRKNLIILRNQGIRYRPLSNN